MGIDAAEASSPLSPSPSHSRQSTTPLLRSRRQTPVQNEQNFGDVNWQETLVDLLELASHRPCLPIAVCCSSRDELDAVCSAVSNLPFISLASLVLLCS
ncbi:hypothetical protein CK203_001800 [Vitis vinifera]|uniref:Uncharacterized protein n=1 Tax=Vitis vinifera TaxID=29760 RepID=A0A438KJ84_VITVI|nr:hypothetical protein CK203_001800 [Vitis vinifera]